MTIKHLTAALAAAALLVPTAATAESSKGKSGEAQARQQSKAKKKGHAKAKNAVFRGVVISTDLTAGSVVVKVDGANRWGRRFKGQDVTFTVATVKKINVADRNADTKNDLADVLAGDKVQVQARVKSDSVSPIAARKLNDRTAPKPATPDSD